MDEEDQLSNWRKAELILRKDGKTDTPFYKKTLEILNGEPDPTNFKRKSPRENETTES